MNKLYSEVAQEFEDIFESKEAEIAEDPDQKFLEELKQIDERILQKLPDNDLLIVPQISLNVDPKSIEKIRLI